MERKEKEKVEGLPPNFLSTSYIINKGNKVNKPFHIFPVLKYKKCYPVLLCYYSGGAVVVDWSHRMDSPSGAVDILDRTKTRILKNATLRRIRHKVKIEEC